MDVKTRSLKKSFAHWERGKKIIPLGTQTLSKRPEMHVKGVYPIYISKAKGCRIWDVDKNEYIDYPMGLAAVSLGYSYEKTNQAIRDQLEDGIVYTLMHSLEVELAELIIDTVPCAEAVRFGKTGSDACAAAVKISRAYTGREKIASNGYHGWQDWYNIIHPINKGVPGGLKDYIYEFNYNDISSLEKIFDGNKGEIAAVILEPISLEEPKDNFLQKVMELTHKNGAVLIFDEIITGFRFAIGGAQEYFNVIPDIACIGKAMANGMPISAVAGKKDIMKSAEDIFISFTHGGEALSMASAISAITETKKNHVTEHIWKVGQVLKDGYNKLVKDYCLEGFTKSCGMAPHTLQTFYDYEGFDHLEVKSLFLQETIKRGILFGLIQNPSYSHTIENINCSLNAAEDALKIVKKAIGDKNILKYLEGEVAIEIVRKN
ncbi:MAG: aminotransferase class III-fold pyridoxal phosphate-dependent enzyme [Ruminiclostridium sp.]|nr:aminotransferase class III-fold pyridoxal phosphate-dependent enzyme [Ruminiclostridium sp.]